jgi:ketosteroid isomerase-like protein
MSEEFTTPDLVDRVRRGYEASNRKEIDALMSVYGPDAIWDMTPVGLGTYEGLAAVRDILEEWIGAFEEFEVEVEEVLDLGGGVTLVVALQSGRPVGSDGRVQWRYAQVSVWVDDVAERSTNYADIDEARAAAARLADSRG